MRGVCWIITALALTTIFSIAPAAGTTVDWEINGTWQTTDTPIAMARSGDDGRTFLLTAEHHILVMDHEGRQEALIPVDDSVTAIEVSPAGDQLFLLKPASREVQAISLSFAVDIDISGSPFLGMADAPVTIAVFSDFQCPYCSRLVDVLHEALDLYPESVRIVFKNFPLASHKLAEPAARAALAAANQGKFWPYHDLLFENQQGLTNYKLQEFATELGLNLPKFNADMAGIDVRQQLVRDIQEGQKAKISGTPTVFVNGRFLKDKTLAGLRRLIDEELARQQKQDGGNVER